MAQAHILPLAVFALPKESSGLCGPQWLKYPSPFLKMQVSEVRSSPQRSHGKVCGTSPKWSPAGGRVWTSERTKKSAGLSLPCFWQEGRQVWLELCFSYFLQSLGLWDPASPCPPPAFLPSSTVCQNWALPLHPGQTFAPSPPPEENARRAFLPVQCSSGLKPLEGESEAS